MQTRDRMSRKIEITQLMLFLYSLLYLENAKFSHLIFSGCDALSGLSHDLKKWRDLTLLWVHGKNLAAKPVIPNFLLIQLI